MMPSCFKCFYKNFKYVMLFMPFYMAFGVFYPTKMVYINSILMSIANVIMFTISNVVIDCTLLIRSYFV